MENMLCLSFRFDAIEFKRLINPLTKKDLKPFELAISAFAKKAINDVNQMTYDHIGQHRKELHRHQRNFFIYSGGGAICFGAWYAVAKISALALGLGSICAGGIVWEKYQSDQVVKSATTAHQAMLYTRQSTARVESKMLDLTNQRFKELETDELVKTGRIKFDDHDHNIGEQGQQLVVHSNQFTEHKDLISGHDIKFDDQATEITTLRAANEEKDQQLAQQAGDLTDLRTSDQQKSQQILDLRTSDQQKSQQLAQQAGDLLNLRTSDQQKSQQLAQQAGDLLNLRTSDQQKNQQLAQQAGDLLNLRTSDQQKSQQLAQQAGDLLNLRTSDQQKSQQLAQQAGDLLNLRTSDQQKSQQLANQDLRLLNLERLLLGQANQEAQ